MGRTSQGDKNWNVPFYGSFTTKSPRHNKVLPSEGFRSGTPLKIVRVVSRAGLRFLRGWTEQVLWCLGALVVKEFRIYATSDST
jgi:hypothetical protein